MTEDTAYGDDDTAPELKENDEAGPGSGWQLWKNLAQQSDVFGRPEKFCGNIPGSTWESVTLTCRPSPLMDKLRELSVNDPYSGFTATGHHHLYRFSLADELHLQPSATFSRPA